MSTAQRGNGVKLHVFFTSALDGDKYSYACSARFTPRSENLKARHHLEDMVVDGRIISRWI
jgi:hypothetical protein